jgi:8-oxo-dGTP pyrophosphatase MutT (NUDIX family)
MNFSSAGILFKDSGDEKSTYLSGWNPKLNAWSGFGGKRRGDETAWKTALREVIEEIFGLRIKKESLHILFETISPTEFFQNDTYVCFLCSLSTLFEISTYLEGFGYKSPFYIKFPITIDELLVSRTCETVKFPELTDLQMVSLPFENPIDPYFLSDLEYIQKKQL